MPRFYRGVHAVDRLPPFPPASLAPADDFFVDSVEALHERLDAERSVARG